MPRSYVLAQNWIYWQECSNSDFTADLLKSHLKWEGNCTVQMHTERNRSMPENWVTHSGRTRKMKIMQEGSRFWSHLHIIPKWRIKQWPKYSPRQKQMPSFAMVQGKNDFSTFLGATLSGKGRSLQCSHQPINDVCSNQTLTEVIYLDQLSAKSLILLNAYI